VAVVLLPVGALTGVAAEPPAPEVQREMARFEQAWPAKLPHDEPRFGIIRVLSLFSLERAGLGRIKAAGAAGQ